MQLGGYMDMENIHSYIGNDKRKGSKNHDSFILSATN